MGLAQPWQRYTYVLSECLLFLFFFFLRFVELPHILPGRPVVKASLVGNHCPKWAKNTKAHFSRICKAQTDLADRPTRLDRPMFLQSKF